MNILAIAVARAPFGLQYLEQLRNLPCEFCNVLVVKLSVLLPIGWIEFEWHPVPDGKKLVAKNFLHGNRERLLGVNRRLDHLEHPRLVADHQPPGLLRTLAKFAGLARAPLRI